MDASGVARVGVVDLPPVLRGFLLKPEDVVWGDDLLPMQLLDGTWVHWGTVATSGHQVMIQVSRTPA
jgi:hypothetical protein